MFLVHYFKNKKNILLAALISFLLLESLSFAFIVYTQNKTRNNYLTLATPEFKAHINIANAYITNIAKIFYDTSINTPQTIEIMDKASQTKDKKQLAYLRKKLLENLSPIYTKMKKYHVRQLHFHLPDAISFLRFHKPNKFGDSLLNVRKSISYVNEYKTPISTFEEGRIFNGFRNVYPIFKGHKFLGSVEISFSFDAIREILTKLDHTSFLFIIKRSIINKKVFADEKFNYIKSEFSGFNYDKETLKDTMQLSLSTLAKINNIIKNDIEKKFKTNKSFSTSLHNEKLYKDNSIIINFFPISNLDGEVVAYIIHYEFGTFMDMLLKNIKLQFWILSFLSFILTSIFTVVLLNERKKQDRIHHFSVHDALTGIYNRHGVNEILNQKLEEYKRENKAFSIIFFDIDFFKRVNDTYGHDMGDFVLKNIAKIVNSEIRASDIFARWGGEEFILFLPNTDISSSLELAQKLRKSIQEHVFSSVDQITCSFGVTTLRPEDTKISFLKRVDTLLYQAKESGRNCVVSDIKP